MGILRRKKNLRKSNPMQVRSVYAFETSRRAPYFLLGHFQME